MEVYFAFLMSLCNNSGFQFSKVVASTMAKNYHQEDRMNFQGTFVSLGGLLGVYLYNRILLISKEYQIRYIIIISLISFGYIGLSICASFSNSILFFISLIFVFIMGIAHGIGDPTCISQFKERIGENSLQGWGTGSGLAGVMPCVLLILFGQFKLSMNIQVICYSFVVVVYIFSQLGLEYEFKRNERNIMDQTLSREANQLNKELRIDNDDLSSESYDKSFDDYIDDKYNLECRNSTVESLKEPVSNQQQIYQIGNMLIVQYFSYQISYFLNERISYKFYNQWWYLNFQTVSILFQRIGNLIARSTIGQFRVEQVSITNGVLFILYLFRIQQTINTNAQTSQAIQLLVIIDFVSGIVSGFSQMNLYKNLEQEEFSDEDKLWMRSVLTSCLFLGIFLSNVSGLAQSMYFFSFTEID